MKPTVRHIFFLLMLSLMIRAFAVGQIPRTITEPFNERPRYWWYAEPLATPAFSRMYQGGDAIMINRSTLTKWMYTTPKIDPRQNWSAKLTATSTTSGNAGGFGVIVTAAERAYVFHISCPSKYIWVASYTYATQAWKHFTYVTVPDAIGATGTPQTVAVQRNGAQLSMIVNEKTVASYSISDSLTDLGTAVIGFGVMVADTNEAHFHDFEARYVEPAMPVRADAFLNVRKTAVKEFAGETCRYPVISPNGQQIYYVCTDSITSDNVWSAEALSDSTWTQGRPLPPPINNKSPNSIVSVSQDGNELMMWGHFNADGNYLQPGFSTSRRTADGWTLPQAIPTDHAASTSPTREECVSADRSVAIVARQIDSDTKGNKDLYVSFRRPDGSYGPLSNLGPEVNTSGNESGPFLATDNRTLYWYSDLDTYGDADIFVSKRLDDTWTKWSPRVNLGPTINTAGWDAYFCIHPSGRYAYMNTNDGYTSGICRLDLPNDPASRALLPDPVVIVRGRVLHAKTKQPLGVEIRYDDLGTNKNIGTAVSEPKEGRYSVVLTGGRSYGIYANRDGFFPVSDNIELMDLKQYQVVERDLYLEPIEVGATIRLNNLFFDTDKAILRAESTAELDRLIALLKARTTIVISIDGHTDDRGTDAHNNKLSTDRANAVMAYLVKAGIASERLKAKGYGKTKPVEKGTSDAARQRNRRVEFSITSI